MFYRAQHVLHCSCGRERILANGPCAICYTLRRQDTAYFGDLREAVLERDGYCCRICDAPGRGNWEIVVPHRVLRRLVLNLMSSLCPGCHARVHRTRRCSRLCRHFCRSCGESSIPKVMTGAARLHHEEACGQGVSSFGEEKEANGQSGQSLAVSAIHVGMSLLYPKELIPSLDE